MFITKYKSCSIAFGGNSYDNLVLIPKFVLMYSVIETRKHNTVRVPKHLTKAKKIR